ncbi:ArnT family glycosyltransferase [Pyrococcus abyssi]|uniref:Glycosyltransferase RgtA/B/C/D-like domain-containing protein n=1 Tax=Pyrococcus abyssi (strain GE5 / Orsay) TaxID=272844 RepID=Q9UZ76_PYRAB|nr:glycosyltransferase family 39 protein [Pyrococcus abyssi]CAB50183.1 Hypothetical protein PAB1532 [Pyrococcus abyssi GE5]CCE70717.1 TPA: hypothetical protein PAB1532 [Pyrococcus abyssi GE5]
MKRKPELLMLLVFVVYIALRLPLLFPTNEYWDYDEGTYLLIARYINLGYLPYRDVLAVHPPLFYYLLALWLRVFGDSYIVGRLFSLSFGALSLILAYKVGKIVRDEMLGVLFSLLLALDPQTIILNSTVFHASLIEFFVLLTLYLYLKGKYLLMAFLLGVGTSVKHTFLPYAVGVFMFSWVGGKIKIKKLNFWKSLLLTYSTYLIVVYTLISLYPGDVSRMILIVPGFGEVKFKPNLYALLLFFILLAYYVYRDGEILVSRIDILNGLRLFFMFILGKLLIEAPQIAIAGYGYIRQVYLMNSGRGIPLMSIPDLIAKTLRDIQKGNYEMLYPYILMIFLAMLLISERRPANSTLKGLLASVALSYLVFPLPGVPRFLYPLFLLIILYLSAMVTNLNLRKLAALTIILLAINSIFIESFITGKTKLAFAVHSDSLRLELTKVVPQDSLAYSFNPMNSYLLNLNEPPYYIDNFGAFYLGNVSPEQFFSYLEENNVSYIIISTWLRGIMDRDPRLSKLYGTTLRLIDSKYKLIYAHSFSNGELMAVYMRSKGGKSFITLNVTKVKIAFNANGTTLFYLVPHRDVKEVTLRAVGDEYLVTFGNSTEIVSIAGNEVSISTAFPVKMEFLEPPVLIEYTLYLQKHLIRVTSGVFRINGTIISIIPENGTISLVLYKRDSRL